MSAILLCAIAVYGPQLTFVDGAFNVTDGDKTETVALNAGAASAPLVGDNISMQVGDVLVTFDERGLGIQYGKQGGFTTLSYMPTTPKLFSAEEIKANADAITSGERSARVSAVSGFVVVKDTLYMLMRWEDKDGKPWLETLVDLDTSGAAPKVGLVDKLVGTSFASGTVSDQLHAAGESVYVVTRTADSLLVESYDTVTAKMDRRTVGPAVDILRPFGSEYLTVRKTAYGTRIVGFYKTGGGPPHEVYETRGTVVPASLTSAFVVDEWDGRYLVDVSSGGKLALGKDSGYAPSSSGVIVWSPADAPEKATLYGSGGWTPVAEWTKK
ncbi:MAG TPA: hypothetical protein VNI20_08540 [Fimbriimonadaceae bacterium]|nr:hypothetical protein [Fimbriimonadaceae bacterium]